MSFEITCSEESVDLLSKKWRIPEEIYDLVTAKRNDISNISINIDGVIFHIPILTKDKLYVLWKCLWPDCHNCCEQQIRLPLTKDDISILANKLEYASMSDFIKNETYISSWQEFKSQDNILITYSMISLKRQKKELKDQDGTKVPCRFITHKGCSIHTEKPGVCWMYPFSPWIESNDNNGSTNRRVTIHARFLFTGDCPGFYVDKTLEPMMPLLKEYSKRIYNYCMAARRTTRDGFSHISYINSA